MVNTKIVTKVSTSLMALNDLIYVSKADPTNYDAFIYADRIMSKEKRWDEVINKRETSGETSGGKRVDTHKFKKT